MSKYKISGYTTTRNTSEMDYPFVESIESLLEFCDEVVVADSSDGKDDTMDILQKLMEKNDRLFVYHVDVNWDAPNHGIYDGKMKAIARSKCTGDYLWQMDVDEIVEPSPRAKIETLLGQSVNFMDKTPIIALPVVEYWGSNGKVRVDVNPWKWRLSKNLPSITHGIPAKLRKVENGLLYAKHGTDGCDYIDKKTGEIIPFANFVTPQVSQLRLSAISDQVATKNYENWFNMIVEHLPTTFHFSWWSIANKIKKYKLFWNDSWISLYNEQRPPGFNPFFENKSLEEVTEEEIIQKALELEQNTGGHIFHTPWQGQHTNHVILEANIPPLAKKWAEVHKL